MKLSKRARRWLIAIAVLFALFTLVSFFVLPPVIRSQAEKQLSTRLGRSVHLGKVHLNPFALSLTLEDFDIQEKDTHGSFLGWKRLYVDFEALASLKGDWVLGDVELDGFHAAVAINPDGSFNFSDILAKLAASSADTPAPQKTAKPSRPLRVDRLAVMGARVDFSDRSRHQPFATVVGPLTFTLTSFRTAGDRGAPYHFEAVTESGEKFVWSGTLAADPVESTGSFEIANLLLKKYTPYFEDRVQADLAEGKLSLSGRYEIRLAGEQRTMKLMDGQVHLSDLRLLERTGAAPVFELKALDVDGIQADATALKASVAHVTLTGGRASVRREKDGSLNVLALLSPSAAPASSAAASVAAVPVAAGAAPGPLPDVSVEEIALKDFALEFSDRSLAAPAQLALSQVQVALKHFSLAGTAPMPLDLSFSWAPKGTVHVAGQVTLKPAVVADLKTEIDGFEILPLSPYVEQFVNARITQGAFSTTNTVHLSLAGGQPAVEFAGDVKVERLGLVDSTRNQDLAGFSALSLTGLKASTAPRLTVSIAEIGVNGPFARVLVNADHSLNFAALAKTEAAAKSPAPSAPADVAASPVAAATPTAKPLVEVGRVVIADGDFRFTDQSIEPNVRTSLSQFGGTISGLSSENVAKADVALQGMVGGAGPVAITGKLDPLGAQKYVQLKIEVKNIDLLPLSPYSGKFAGYGIARGKLIVGVNFLLDGKKIDSTNVVTLDQFTFGEATNSPDAVKLPVRLGVSLLKDIDGKIVIDLPVQGSLDDPDFRIGKVVWRVVGNLLTKAAVSPFSLIGSMFGGGGDELAYQEFAPGSTELQSTETAKLETLIKALANRPGLSVCLEGGYDTAADAYALKKRRLADFVRRRIWEVRHATNPNLPPPKQLTITAEENAAMIKKLFDEKFPPGTQFGTPLPPPPAVVEPPPPPKGGFFKRLVDVITFRSERERLAAQRENNRRAAEHQKAVTAAEKAGLPLEEMTGRLAQTMEISDNDLRAIAARRAERVRDYLINTGHVAPDRLFLTQGSDAPGSAGKGPRVFLSLQ